MYPCNSLPCVLRNQSWCIELTTCKLRPAEWGGKSHPPGGAGGSLSIWASSLEKWNPRSPFDWRHSHTKQSQGFFLLTEPQKPGGAIEQGRGGEGGGPSRPSHIKEEARDSLLESNSTSKVRSPTFLTKVQQELMAGLLNSSFYVNVQILVWAGLSNCKMHIDSNFSKVVFLFICYI